MSNGRIRPTWDEHWIQAAANAAQRSLCSRDQVGAVIVDTRNEIVSTGYNNPPRGFIHEGKPCTVWCARAAARLDGSVYDPPDLMYGDCPSLHAEANALMMSEKAHRQGGTIYVNSHVCFTCAKLIANSGIKRVVVCPSGKADHRGPDAGYVFLRTCGLTVEIIGGMAA